MRYTTTRAQRATLLALATVGLATVAGAQQRAGGGPMSGMPRFNPATVVALEGTISKIERLAGQRAGMTGIHLLLQTSDGATSGIHLGPTVWVDSQAVKLAEGDKVIVTGSKVSWSGAPIVLAKTVEKQGATLTLRDNAGFPLWAGKMMGTPKRSR